MRYAEWSYGPQGRFLISPHIEIQGEGKLFDVMMINSSYQRLSESRRVRDFNSNLLTEQIEDLDVGCDGTIGMSIDACDYRS